MSSAPTWFFLAPGMSTAYAVDSGAVLRVLDTGMYICLFLSPWMIASSVMVTVWLHNRKIKGSAREAETLDFGVLVIAGYQTVLSQSTAQVSLSSSKLTDTPHRDMR